MAIATVSSPPQEQRFRVSLVNWPTYLEFCRLLEGRHVRLTYDEGEMEVMTLSPEHERSKSTMARLIEALAEELDLDIACYGSMTCQREDLEKGLEGDESYWIQHEAMVRGRDDVGLNTDPPPDLVLEVEINRSALDRMKIYAKLGVPEVWRWDGERLRVCLLRPNGRYKEGERSKAFPKVPVTELAKFHKIMSEQGERQGMRQFRAWVREQIKKGWK